MLRGLLVGVRQQLLRGHVTTGGQTFHTRRHLYTQCLQEQQACEKEWVWIIKIFFPVLKKRHALGNMKPGIQACHLDIYHGACLHTIKRLSRDCFRRGGRRATKGPIILNHSSPFR